MKKDPLFDEAAGFLDGALFVLRQTGDGHHHLHSAVGTLAPFAFDTSDVARGGIDAVFAQMPVATAKPLLRALKRLWRLRGSFRRRFDMHVDDRHMRLELRARVSQHGPDLVMTGFLKDRTEIAEADAGHKMGATLEAAIRLFPDMVWLKDTAGCYLVCNEMFERFNGMANTALIGKRASVTSEGKIAPIHDLTDRQALESNEIVAFEHVAGADPATMRFFDVRKLAMRDGDGNPIGILGTARETTQWRRLEQEIRQSEAAYRSLADNIPDRLIRFGSDDTFLHMNRPMREFFEAVDYPKHGVPPEKPSYPSANVAAAQEILQSLREALACGEASSKEVRFIDQQGATVFHELRYVPEFAANGRVDSVLAIGRDITARKAMEQQLAEKEAELHALAFRDGLTGLHNRRSFQALLEDVLDQTRIPSSLSALLLLDIDRFKYVNDTLGHAAGDNLIREFSSRLVETVAGIGHVFRLGGDEFAIILPELASQDIASRIAEDIHRAFATPVRFGANAMTITTSIGLAFGDSSRDDQIALFRFADMALYAAKAGGRARTTVYDGSMAERAARRFELEGLIGEGLRNDEFTTYFQTKNDLATGRINGLEALCRWIRPDGQFIAPGEFIPISEETGDIVEIGRRVLRDACAFAVRVNAARLDPLAVSVNVSARQLLFGGFVGALGACLEETGCKSHWIELELTESLLLGEDSNISDILAAIVRLGVTLTVDDFGTGYSSLSYLARFPITTLKIDQAFVRELERNEKGDVLCRAIISMAHGLGLKTVAEGIETRKVALRLRQLGCDTGQGYLWGKPEPANRVFPRIDDEQRKTGVA